MIEDRRTEVYDQEHSAAMKALREAAGKNRASFQLFIIEHPGDDEVGHTAQAIGAVRAGDAKIMASAAYEVFKESLSVAIACGLVSNLEEFLDVVTNYRVDEERGEQR